MLISCNKDVRMADSIALGVPHCKYSNEWVYSVIQSPSQP